MGYWLVTGQRVFERDSTLSTVVAHVQEQPVPPSQRTELDIPAALERVILSCLEKDPADRPQSTADLDAMLVSCLADCEWSTQSAKDWWDLHVSEADSLAEIDEIEELSSQEFVRVRR